MRIALAASWDIAARLSAAGPPDLRVFQTHPGGGQYDCLTLASPAFHIDINRRGSIHVHRGANLPPMQWLERSTEREGTLLVARQIGEASAGPCIGRP